MVDQIKSHHSTIEFKSVQGDEEADDLLSYTEVVDLKSDKKPVQNYKTILRKKMIKRINNTNEEAKYIKELGQWQVQKLNTIWLVTISKR